MSRTLRIALPLLLLTVLAGCSTAPPAPGEMAVESVALDIDGAAPAFIPVLDGPLRLLSATPQGPLATMPPHTTIAVTFSRPMVPLGTTAAVPPGTITLTPAVDGTYRWEGTQTLVFEPATPLAPATAYTATLRPLTALDGEPLEAPYTWTFETPRPRLVSSTPASGETHAAPQQSIRLAFNLPVEAARAEAFLALVERRAPAANALTVSVRNAAPDTLVLVPAAPLKPGTAYEVVLQPGLPTPVGPLGLEHEARVPYSTYGPLRLMEAEQPRNYWDDASKGYDPERGITLHFNNPVRFSALRQALTITPAVPLPPGLEARDDAVAASHTLPLTWQPETRYTVAVAGLADVFGQTLAAAEATFRTRAYSPQMRMPEGILVMEGGQQTTLPVQVTNVAAAQVGLAALGPDAIVPALHLYDDQHYYGPEPEEGAAPPPPMPADQPITPGLPRNTPGTYALPLDTLLADGLGVVAVHLHVDRQPGWSSDRSYKALVQVTRLGVSAKFSPHQNLILVTTLADATPVAGAQVTIRNGRNEVRWQGTTDAQGRALTPGWDALGIAPPDPWSQPVQYVIVEKDGDLAFTASALNDGLEPYRFDVPYAWKPEAQTTAGSVFSDRGLYRAGDTVYLKGILRRRTDADWRPVTDSIRVLIDSPRDQRVFDRRYAPSALGTFDLSWIAPPDADLGSYHVRVALARDTTAADRQAWEDGDLAQGQFRVDAFRTATFSVDARTAAAAYTAGDFFEGTVSGRYLFGAAMRGQPVSYRLTRSGTWYTPPGFDGYRFTPLDLYGGDGSLYLQLAQEETTLDDEGALQIRRPLPGNAQGQATRLGFEATVTDPARQALSARTEVMLHPGRYYIGLKPQTTFINLAADPTLVVDVITVSPDGRAVPEQTVAVEVVRRQWNSVREVGVDGRLRWRSERTEERVAADSVRTAPGRAQRLRTRITQGGSYVIRATGYDLRGNTIRSEAYFYATGSGYVAWARSDDDRIDLVADRATYRPGETARLMVQSPYESATALITVERDGILSSRVTTLTGSAPQVEIPLTEAHLPNVFVSVMLLHGRSAPAGTVDDAGAPGFKIGYVQLGVDPGVRHLQVAIAPDRTTYRPGETATVEVRLRDASGRGVAGEVVFSAADAGVLNLIGYTLPDPFEAFYGPRPLRVHTTETRANLVKQRSFGQKEEADGGGGGDRDRLMRSDFRPLAHWAPAIKTDSRGRATVTFRFPESLTTFRLMAAALTAGNHFGAAATDVVVTKPLVLQPALPRFARLGDRFEAGVLVTNTTGADGEAVIQATATGIDLAGDATRRIPLADGETREVRFQWQVTTVGTTSLTFSAALGSEQDALAIPLALSRPTTRHTAATFAATDADAREALALPADRLPGLGRFNVQLASTALVGLGEASRYLFEYPYGCLEQRTSRIRPLLLATPLLEAFDLEVLGGDRQAEVERWLGLLDGYWVGNGFGLWTGSRQWNPYVTGYVVLAMAEAEAAGFSVPAHLKAQATDALSDHVRNRSRKPDYYSAAAWNTTRAMMLYALARHGTYLIDEAATLAEALLAQPAAEAEGLSYLLRLVVAADRPALNRYHARLLERLQAAVRVEATTAYLTVPDTPGYGWIFASNTRATAYGLTALVEAAPTDGTRQLAQRMVRYLMRQRQGGHWASTQDNAAVIDAFRAYFAAYETDTPDFTAAVRLAGQEVLTAAFRERSAHVAAAEVGLDALPPDGTASVVVDKQGRGLLYYSLLLETYSDAPQAALNQGLRVTRTLQPLDASGQPTGTALPAGASTLQAGDLVRVTLRVSTPADRNYVVVDDALPAGLEALNVAFETTGEAATAGTGADRWWGSFNHSEIHDDRVLLFADFMQRGEHTYTYVARATTPGRFVHPPVQAALMYQPETHGRNATGTLVVAPPTDP